MSDRFVIHEISGYRMAGLPTAGRSHTQPLTVDVAVHDSWYGYEIVARYPAPIKGYQHLEARRDLARAECARLNRAEA